MSVIPLDGIAYGTQGLEALFAIHLGDAHVHAAFVREGAALPVADLAVSLRDAYRSCQGAARRLPARYRSRPPASAGASVDGAGGATAVAVAVAAAVAVNMGGARLSLSSRPPREAPEPLVMLEEGGCTVLLRRVRAYLVACLFDASMPLGMSRLLAGRLIATLSPELPLDETDELQPGGEVRGPLGANAPADRARRLLALLEGLTPEPHVARLRVALRAGLPPSSLDQPEALGSDAIPRIETAVEELLGLDRAALRRLL